MSGSANCCCIASCLIKVAHLIYPIGISYAATLSVQSRVDTIKDFIEFDDYKQVLAQ
jgi:hypothetical protein